MNFKNRKLYPDELRIFKVLKIKAETENKKGCKSKMCQIVLSALAGIASMYLLMLIERDTFWHFIFGSVAALSVIFFIVMPYEFYKMKKQYEKFMKNLNILIEKQTINTCQIVAKRIAFAKEYRTNSYWYIIETSEDTVLYLWDTEYNLNRRFPCLQFEIYENIVFELIGRQIYASSPKIKPIIIDPEKAWKYTILCQQQIDTTEQLDGASKFVLTEKLKFDDVISEIEKF